MALNNPTVLGEPIPGEVAPATLPDPGVATATTQEAPSDAEAKLAAFQQETEAKLKQYQRDLDAQKGSLQRRESQLTKEWKEREARYKSEIERLQTSTMDDEQRKAYEVDITKRRLAEAQEAMDQLAREKADVENTFAAYNYFLSRKVPADALVTGQGYDELWRSGMEYLDNELERLRAAAAAPKQEPVVQKPPVAPVVATANGAAPLTGRTWPDLIKQYGSMEEVYRLVETQQLSPTIIPIRQG